MSLLSSQASIVTLNLQDAFFADGESNCIEQIPWEQWLQTWLTAAQTDLPVANGYEITLRFTNDREIQALNHQYRQINQPTDVLAFAALEIDFPNPVMDMLLDEPLYLGDIVISVDTATKQAQERGYALTRELAWLAAHGLLHLLGWDHPDDASLAKMLSKQETFLNLVGL